MAILSLSAFSAFADEPVCGDRVVVREGRLNLSRNESVLVCGSSDGPEAWREVPLAQSEYQLGVLLYNRGYFKPRFAREGSRLVIWTGPRALVTALEVRDAPEFLDPAKKRKVIGAPIEPQVLDDVKAWAENRLLTNGYPCPAVKTSAEAWNGHLIADVKSGPRQKVKDIAYAGLDGMAPEMMARYQALQPGEEYDVRGAQLTTWRLLADGLVQSAHFTTKCTPEGAELLLSMNIGRPRLLRFGVGATTEEFPFARVWYKNARLDARASSFTAVVYGSPVHQSLEASAEFFRLPFTRKGYIGPRVFSGREKERSFEVVRARAGVDLGRAFDRWSVRWTSRAGPTFNYVDTVQGIGPSHLSFLSWEGALTATSRDYELYTRDQYSGWTGEVTYHGQREGIGSPVNVDRFDAGWKHLWDIGGYSPPLFVLGTRLQGISVATKQIADLSRALDVEREAAGRNRRLLPVDYRVFFGGDENLRGFGRHVLDNQKLGYTTAIYGGWELRLVAELPYRLEPFVLFDAAGLGARTLTLDPPVFLSAGYGLRWASPFGTLRGSAARGWILHEDALTSRYPQEWVYFLSFGQEF